MKIKDKKDLLELLNNTVVDSDKFVIGFKQAVFLGTKKGFLPVAIEGNGGIRDILTYFKNKYDYANLNPLNILDGLVDTKGNQIKILRGGQIEFSTTNAYSPNYIAVFHSTFFRRLEEYGNEIGFNVFFIGHQPFCETKNMPANYNKKYTALKSIIAETNPLLNPADIFQSSASASVKINYDNELNMVKMFRVSLALLPIVKAIFTNSSIINKKITPFESYQSHLYHLLNNKIEFYSMVFNRGFSFEKYLDYILNIKMPYVVINNEYVKVNNQTFVDYMEGNLTVALNQQPSQEDFYRLFSFVNSSVRIKKAAIEITGIDSCSPLIMIALPALFSSIIYSNSALDKVYKYITDWAAEDIFNLNKEIATKSLNARINNLTVQEIGKHILEIAQESAKAQGFNGEIFLSPIEEILTTGHTSATNWKLIFKKHEDDLNEDDFESIINDMMEDSNKYYIS